MKSFIGRLSRDETLVADQVSGEISELRTDTLREWHGKLNLPIALRKLPYESSSLRLDCNDGFSIMINLGESTASSDGKGIGVSFQSTGRPLK